MLRRIRKPTHPGAIIQEDILPATGLSVTAFADRLGVARGTLSDLIHEHRALSPDIALRLARACGNSPEFWLRMQVSVDLWETKQAHQGEYEQIKPVEMATTT
jgi:addiction module HigA family antidote